MYILIYFSNAYSPLFYECEEEVFQSLQGQEKDASWLTNVLLEET